jgi:hypothetical protein
MYSILLTLHDNVIPLFGAVLIAITIVIPLFLIIILSLLSSHLALRF